MQQLLSLVQRDCCIKLSSYARTRALAVLFPCHCKRIAIARVHGIQFQGFLGSTTSSVPLDVETKVCK